MVLGKEDGRSHNWAGQRPSTGFIDTNNAPIVGCSGFCLERQKPLGWHSMPAHTLVSPN
jgi:hypothetical protein